MAYHPDRPPVTGHPRASAVRLKPPAAACGVLLGLVAMASGGVCTPVEEQKLIPLDAAGGQQAGSSVAVDGDTAVVGAGSDDEILSGAGAAYVWERAGARWVQGPKLAASDPEALAFFGDACAISGDTIVVGAWEDGEVVGSYGAVYVFERMGGIWGEVQKLVSPDADPDDEFGYSVAIDGDTIAIGSRRDSEAGGGAGAVYVYERAGGVWSFQGKLIPPGAMSGDDLGHSVAVDGGTIVGGAPGDGSGASAGGALHVWVRTGGGWAYQQQLLAGDPDAADRLGWSVDVSGDSIVGGAPFDDGLTTDAGAAYVFVRAGGVWTQQQKLTADEATFMAFDDRFGQSVGIDGGAVLVGASSEDDPGSTSLAGGGYLFVGEGGAWSQVAKLKADPPVGNAQLGWSGALSGGVALLGAVTDSEAGGGAGAVHVFDVSSCVAAPGAPGDLDGDGDVDSADLNLLLADFGCVPPGDCPGDVEGDGDTDSADLNALLASFGT